MKRWALALFLILAPTTDAQVVRLVTEEYPPYNFSTGDGISGAATDQVVLIMEALALPYTIEVLPWARAFAMAETMTDHCVFTTGHDEERDALFKWVEPLAIDRMVMLRKAGTDVEPATLEDAKRFTIGTQRDDFSETFLTKNGFPKIDLATDIETTLKKLLSGRIDMMMTSQKTFERMRADGTPVESALALEGQKYGIACNLGISDALVAKMQAELDRLVADGTQQRIFDRYGLTPSR